MANNSEKDFNHLTVSVNKALNGIEAPLKSKHARSVIIIIHKSKEAKSFWTAISRQPIMENRFTAWKFCHLLHKVLREAHECALQHSQKYTKMILEVGKSWGHLQDDIGYCIKAYSKLLVTKLNFHEKNRIYPGCLIKPFAEVTSIVNTDFNYNFQLCVEIFDYLEDIIALQLAILFSINTYRISSMTKQGQCRLSPLITLIQDSNPLYDISVRLMFKLHEDLPNDVLCGHRERFCSIFARLKAFYENVRPLEYFKDLITVPQLPEQSPNFKSQVDFGSYIPPIVVVQPEQEPDQIVDDLIDTNISETIVEQDQILNERINALESIIDDKNETIDQLKGKLNSWKSNFDGLELSYKNDIMALQRSNTDLLNDLASSKEVCANLRVQKDELELQLTNNPLLIQKVFEEEEKQKLSSEKFKKLKLMYTQIRDEHISLLRQQSDYSKSLNKEKQINAELLLQIKDLNNQFLQMNENIAADKLHYLKLLQENENLKELNLSIEAIGKEMKQKCDTIIQEKKNEILDLYSKINILKEKNTELDRIKLVLQEKEGKLAQADSLINFKNEEIIQNLKKYENESVRLSTINKEYQETLQNDCQALRAVLNDTEDKLRRSENYLQESNASVALLNNEKILSEELLSDFQKKIIQSEDNLTKALNKAEHLTNLNQEGLKSIEMFRKLTIEAVKDICVSKLSDEVQQPLEVVSKISSETNLLLNKLEACSHIEINDCKEKIRDIIYLGYFFIKLYDQCDVIYKSTTEIEKGQAILKKVRSMCPDLLQLFDFVQTDESNQQVNCINEIQIKLSALNELVQGILNNLENSIDLDKLIAIELKEMDIAIEEAASKIMDLLSRSRENDNKIKLEVNEKILAACTSLMECIKVLILKSRVLQLEIVSSQKGTATENEFYKRNSQWSDGLISASKSVAKAANYLVEAANNAINNESGQNFELIVAAQEIAACTVQLVIASKVKANRDSENLVNLTIASRNVTKATGVVVATVKDGNSRQEQHNEVDFFKLTPSQLKTMEMDIQVKVLELEQALQTQRLKLSAFRKEHYQKTEY